jgi:elongation factor Ts
MAVSIEAIKKLRDLTLASVAHCKEALHEAGGDMDKAAGILRKRGLEIAAKKTDRVAKEGRVEAYIHHGSKLGVLLEVDCETDFVARNEEFVTFCRDVAMHIAAMNPLYIKREDVPAEVLEQEKDAEQFIKGYVLMEQAFVKDAGLQIKDLLGGLLAKFSENIVVRRFVRYKIGA